MKMLSNMRIASRLAAGFAVVLALSAVATVNALVNARASAEATKAMMDLPLAKERVLSDWYVLTYSAIARTAMIARTTDDTLPTVFADVISDSVKRGSAQIKKMETLLVTDEEKALFKDIVAKRVTYQASKDLVMNAKKAGKTEESVKHFNEAFTPAADAYGKGVMHLLEHQRKAIDDAAHAIDDANDRSTTLMLVLGVLLLCVGALAAWVISRSITGPLGNALAVAATVAKGDLTTQFSDKQAGDEIGDLMKALHTMNDALRTVVSEVQVGTRTIATASNEIAAGNLDLSSRTEEQASSLEETASSMEELTSTVRQNAENAKQANQLALAASGVAEKGGDIVGQVVNTMGSINESSRKIVDIIGVIDGIAFQTNILALNAAVEAARAGEQGRGFAVVASEVRNLAQRSAGAAKEIKELIGNSVDQVDIGSKLVEQAGSTMHDVVTSVRRVTDIMAEITSASSEQSIGIDQVNAAITQMDAVTQQNAALVEQAAAAAASMQEQAERLADVASTFNLGADAGTYAAPAAVQRAPAARVTPSKPVKARVAVAHAAKPLQPAAARTAPKKTVAAGDADGWEEF